MSISSGHRGSGAHEDGRQMRMLISFAALLLSVLLLQLGSGGLAPLDAISGIQLDFTRSEIGLLGSAHFSASSSAAFGLRES